MIYSIIPARGGSKGVPGKNIRQLSGHPLLAYSIRASKLSKKISRTIVSTDSDEIAEIAEKYGAEVPFRRPAALAGDKSSDYEFVAHALDWFQKNEGSKPEFLVHLRPTTPLREPALIDAAISAIESRPDATALRSAHEMSESAYKTFEIENGLLKRLASSSFELDAANEARQAFPKTYQANGYVDVLRTSFVLENQRIHGNRGLAFTTPTAIEVDTLADFELLEFALQKNQALLQKLFG